MKNIILKVFMLAVISLAINLAFTSGVYSQEAQYKKAIDFTLEAISGEEIILSDLLKERKAVLVFWATWCPHCRKEMPHVEAFYKENKDKIAVVGVNSGESKVKVSKFIQEAGISYPIGLDLDTGVARSYGVRGIPTIIAINKDWQIIYFGHSIEEAADKIK
ncbi:TlpA family protein disulfide reductase [Candidatus Omnitrophota bacterium]